MREVETVEVTLKLPKAFYEAVVIKLIEDHGYYGLTDFFRCSTAVMRSIHTLAAMEGWEDTEEAIARFCEILRERDWE